MRFDFRNTISKIFVEFKLQTLFAQRAFRVFNRNKTEEKVLVDEYTETMAKLIGNNTDTAIEFLFRIYDIDEDEAIDRSELKEVLKASMSESGLTFDDKEGGSA